MVRVKLKRAGSLPPSSVGGYETIAVLSGDIPHLQSAFPNAVLLGALVGCCLAAALVIIAFHTACACGVAADEADDDRWEAVEDPEERPAP